MKDECLLSVSGLNVGYRGIQVLWDLSLEMPKESIVCVIGANGAGKSTLVRTISGLIMPMSGTIRFKGEDITRLPAYRRAERRLILIPDERGLFPEMTVYENLLMGGNTVKDKAKIREAIAFGYELYPILKERGSQAAGNLSGGEQQMLAMAKALVSQPELLILDEPSSGLAPIVIDQMFEALVTIREKKNISVLLVEQNVRRSLNICDSCYVLENGRVGLHGSADELKNDEKILSMYLGI